MHPNAIALVFACPIYANYRDGTDITGIGCLKLPCRFLKRISLRLRLRKRILPIRIREVPKMDGEFYHLLFLERDTGNVDEDVADAELRRGRELQHKTRIQAIYCRHELLIVLRVPAAIRLVCFVQDYRRTEEFQHIEETLFNQSIGTINSKDAAKLMRMSGSLRQGGLSYRLQIWLFFG